jgi:hypothetical protein
VGSGTDHGGGREKDKERIKVLEKELEKLKVSA